MSFPFGNRTTLRDRTMGKSSDEIFDDMLKNIKQRKKEFFESPPKWRTTGVFDDELGGAGGSRFKAHLGDLAARHPDIADHLLDLLPDEHKTGPTRRGPPTTGVHKKTRQNSNTKEVGEPQTVTTGTQTSGGGLESDVKLRSTVPDMQSSSGESTVDGDRGQRSQSAPPQAPPSLPNKPQQSEEGIRHIPIRTDTPSSGPQLPRQPCQQGFSSRPPSGASHTQQSHAGEQEESRGPTVRHIPIFVEGRDEPLLPKDVSGNFGSKRGGCQGKPEHQEQRKQHHHQEHHAPPQHQQQQQPAHHAQQKAPPSQPQQNQSTRHSPTPPPPPPIQKPDPLSQVAEVMKEVEALGVKVSEWKGSSRGDKEYIYLDEMLTRNLLKLDNIETEGRDEVRTARKEAIRRIQDAISVLESKSEQNAQRQPDQFQLVEASKGEAEKMEVSSAEDITSQQPMDTSNSTSTQT